MQTTNGVGCVYGLAVCAEQRLYRNERPKTLICLVVGILDVRPAAAHVRQFKIRQFRHLESLRMGAAGCGAQQLVVEGFLNGSRARCRLGAIVVVGVGSCCAAGHPRPLRALRRRCHGWRGWRSRWWWRRSSRSCFHGEVIVATPGIAAVSMAAAALIAAGCISAATPATTTIALADVRVAEVAVSNPRIDEVDALRTITFFVLKRWIGRAADGPVSGKVRVAHRVRGQTPHVADFCGRGRHTSACRDEPQLPVGVIRVNQSRCADLRKNIR